MCCLACTEPSCPGHGSCRPQGGGQYPNGTIIIYSCDEGYNLTGYSSIQCLSDGMWTANPPTCTKAKTACTEPDCPKNAACYPRGSTYLTGSAISYRCGRGYYLVGKPSIQCLKGGRWTSDAPQCRAKIFKTCQSQRCPKHAVCRRVDTYGTGRAIIYRCRRGYLLIGKSFSRCLRSGRWNSNPPRCLRRNRKPVTGYY